MRLLEILTEAADAFDNASLGTILTMKSEGTFGGATHVMKLPSGAWQIISQTGADKGVPRFTLDDDKTIDLPILRTAMAANRVGLTLEGLSPGSAIRSGVQVLALPLGAVVGNPSYRASLMNQGVTETEARALTSYHKTEHGMMDSTGKILPAYVFTPDNAVWES